MKLWWFIACFALLLPALASSYVIEGNTVTYENQYGKLTQTPHTLNDFRGYAVINATSNFSSTQSLDFALGFVTSEAKPSAAWKWSEDVAHEVKTWCNVSHSKQCTTNNFTYTTDPKYAWCYNDNGTTAWEHYFVNGWVSNKTIEWFEWEYACTEQQYFDDWSKLSNFNKLSYGGKTWFVVSSVFEPSETKSLKLQIDVQPFASGKYDLFIKRSSDSWDEAFNSGHYVLLDPWFNNTWLRRKAINVSDGWDLDRQNEPINVNVTGLDHTFNCSNARMTWLDNTTTEYNLNFMILDNGAAGVAGSEYCYVQFISNLSSTANTTHPASNQTSFYFYYYNTTDVSRGDSTNLQGWAGQYNAWNDPVSAGWALGLSAGTVQNYTYNLNDNGILLVNDTVLASYAEWNQGVTLFTTRTWELRARVLYNITANSSVTAWVADGAATRRGFSLFNWTPAVGHPDGTYIQQYNTDTNSTFKVYRIVFDSQGTVYTIFEDGVNKTWGSNLTQTNNGGGNFYFGTDYSNNGVGIYEIDYLVYTTNGYFPPLNATVGDAENQTALEIYCRDEQTNNQIRFNLDAYNTTNLVEYTDVFEILVNNQILPQGEITLDFTNSSYYSRRLLYWVDNTTNATITAYLINASAADIIATTFHIRTVLGSVITNATVRIDRTINSSLVTIHEARSDFNGDVFTYLEVNAPYFVTVTHENYNSFFGQVNPSTTDYTIYLSSSGGVSGNISTFIPNSLDTVYWYLSPPYRLLWNETTNISFYVLPTEENLTYWGMNISNSTNDSVYFKNFTTAPLGGTAYYLLNISEFTDENVSVQVWFSHSPNMTLATLYNIDYSWTDWLYPHSLVETRSLLYNSGLSQIGLALLALLITLLIAAWVSQFSPVAALIVAGILISFFSFSNLFSVITPDGNPTGGAWVFVISFIATISVLYLRNQL